MPPLTLALLHDRIFASERERDRLSLSSIFFFINIFIIFSFYKKNNFYNFNLENFLNYRKSSKR